MLIGNRIISYCSIVYWLSVFTSAYAQENLSDKQREALQQCEKVMELVSKEKSRNFGLTFEAMFIRKHFGVASAYNSRN